jgi:hypothetical protein
MPNEDEEVKEPVAPESTDKTEATENEEVLTANDLTDEEKQEAEKETRAQESSGEKKPADEEKSEEKSEDEVVEGGESETVVEPEKKTEPKPVEGETARERALRLEVERVKRANRQLKGDKLLKDIKPEVSQVELDDADQKILESYDPEQLANLDKAFDVLAKKKGLVKESDFVGKQRVQELKDSFESWMDDNPEFSEDKDPDGVMWKALEGQYKDVMAYRPPPRNSKELTKILNGIKKDLFGVTTDTTDLKKVEAQKEKIKVSSHSAGSSAPTKTKSKTIDPELDSLVKGGALKGFDDKDLEEMGLK